MLYDLAENKTVTDWLQRWTGFRVGLGVALILVAVWLPMVFTQPEVTTGDLYGMSMLLHVAVFGFLSIGIVWGLLFRFATGVAWAFGVGLVIAAVAGTIAGFDVAFGWGIDWGFGAKGFYSRIDVQPKGLGPGALSGLIFGAAVGATSVLGSIGAMIGGTLFIRPLVQPRITPLAPTIVRLFPIRVRRVIDPTVRYNSSP